VILSLSLSFSGRRESRWRYSARDSELLSFYPARYSRPSDSTSSFRRWSIALEHPHPVTRDRRRSLRSITVYRARGDLAAEQSATTGCSAFRLGVLARWMRDSGRRNLPSSLPPFLSFSLSETPDHETCKASSRPSFRYRSDSPVHRRFFIRFAKSRFRSSKLSRSISLCHSLESCCMHAPASSFYLARR